MQLSNKVAAAMLIAEIWYTRRYGTVFNRSLMAGALICHLKTDDPLNETTHIINADNVHYFI